MTYYSVIVHFFPNEYRRNSYNEISRVCHECREPVFITKNGQGDLAVMSMETYEALYGKLELYNLLDEGRAAVEAGKKRPLREVMKEIKAGYRDSDVQG